jgi:hypothetical protein
MAGPRKTLVNPKGIPLPHLLNSLQRNRPFFISSGIINFMSELNQKIRTEVLFESHYGKTVSHRKEFFENGNLFREGLYTKRQGEWGWDIPMGPIKTFFEDGILKSNELFDEFGNREGESTFFNKKGELIKKIHYRADKIISEENFEPVEEKSPRFAKGTKPL